MLAAGWALAPIFASAKMTTFAKTLDVGFMVNHLLRLRTGRPRGNANGRPGFELVQQGIASRQFHLCNRGPMDSRRRFCRIRIGFISIRATGRVRGSRSGAPRPLKKANAAASGAECFRAARRFQCRHRGKLRHLFDRRLFGPLLCRRGPRTFVELTRNPDSDGGDNTVTFFHSGRAANFGCSRFSRRLLLTSDEPAESRLQPKLAALHSRSIETLKQL